MRGSEGVGAYKGCGWVNRIKHPLCLSHLVASHCHLAASQRPTLIGWGRGRGCMELGEVGGWGVLFGWGDGDDGVGWESEGLYPPPLAHSTPTPLDGEGDMLFHPYAPPIRWTWHRG